MKSHLAWVAGLVVVSGCTSPLASGPDPTGDPPPAGGVRAPAAAATAAAVENGGGDDQGNGSSCAPPPMLLFNTATLPPQQDLYPAREVDINDFVGVRFTTTEAHEITALGAHIFSGCATCPGTNIAIAVVPLDPTTRLPMTIDLTDAIGYAVGPLPVPTTQHFNPTPASLRLPVSFELPTGTWGLVVATDVLGANAPDGDMPIDVIPVGTPEFFHCYSDGGVGDVCSWADDVNPDPHRMFIEGR